MGVAETFPALLVPLQDQVDPPGDEPDGIWEAYGAAVGDPSGGNLGIQMEAPAGEDRVFSIDDVSWYGSVVNGVVYVTTPDLRGIGAMYLHHTLYLSVAGVLGNSSPNTPMGKPILVWPRAAAMNYIVQGLTSNTNLSTNVMRTRGRYWIVSRMRARKRWATFPG